MATSVTVTTASLVLPTLTFPKFTDDGETMTAANEAATKLRNKNPLGRVMTSSDKDASVRVLSLKIIKHKIF